MKHLRSGFTLIETLVSSAVFAITSACLMAGVVALLRSFDGSTNYAQKHASEIRISDYLALDLRRAQSVIISGSGSAMKIALNIPNFYSYDAAAEPHIAHRLPTITGSGVFYRDLSAAPAVDAVKVEYSLQQGNLVRTQTGGMPSGAPLISATSMVVAANVQDFQLIALSSGTDASALSNFNIPLASATSGKIMEIKTQIKFGATYSKSATANTSGIAPFCNTTLMRNSLTEPLYQ